MVKMRLRLISILLLLVGVSVGQESKPKPDFGKILPTTTKPKMLIAEVKGKPLLVVSEYFLKDLKKSQRVFRYSWKGDYNKLLETLRRKYVGRNGWRMEELYKDGSWEFTRDHKSGPVLMESYLIQSRWFRKDPKSPTGWSGKYTEPGSNGWIWISYNERYAK